MKKGDKDERENDTISMFEHTYSQPITIFWSPYNTLRKIEATDIQGRKYSHQISIILPIQCPNPIVTTYGRCCGNFFPS